MRMIVGLSITYVLLIAAAMAYLSDAGNRTSGVAFGELVLSTPIVISCLLSVFLTRDGPRRIMLTFQIILLVVTGLVFIDTFLGEHDAQYQLALLVIPLIGFPGIIIAGTAAALASRRAKAGKTANA